MTPSPETMPCETKTYDSNKTDTPIHLKTFEEDIFFITPPFQSSLSLPVF
jgi:hypothetical protein